MNYKTIREIENDYDSGVYSVANFCPHYLKDNYVFDENLTIKENKAKIEEHNKEQKAKYVENQQQRNLALKHLKNDIITYLMYDYLFTPAQAEKLYDRIWSENHGSMHTFFYAIDYEAEFIQEFIEEGKEN